MTTTADTPQNGSVFISYSRRDKEFVRQLYEGLVSNDVSAWVDWEGIPLSADWMEEISQAVNRADAFLVVLSPDWLTSKVCAQELELGLKNNKKLIPILYRPPEPGTVMHEKLAATNWVYLRPEDDFQGTLPRLIDAINTDLDWVHDHTRLLVRSTEWDTHNRNSSFLLRGTDLQNAESWMTQAAIHPDREVLPLQADYILVARKEVVRRQRMTLAAISAALLVSIILGVVALIQWRNADNSARLAWAQRNAAEAQNYQKNGNELDISTLLAIDSFKTSTGIDPTGDSHYQAENILRQNLSYMPHPVAKSYLESNNEVTNIQFFPDQSAYVSNGSAGQVCVWDAANHQKRFCFNHGNGFNDAVITPKGLLVSSGNDGKVAFRSTADGADQGTLEIGAEITDLDVSPNGNWLAVGREDSKATVINLSAPEATSTDISLNDPVGVLKISPDSRWLAVGTISGKVSIIRLGTSELIVGPDHQGKGVIDIAFSPDSQLVVSAGVDGTARVAVTETGQLKFPALVHDDWVEDVAFSPDGKTIVTAADDSRVWRWDANTGQASPRLHHNGFVFKAKYSPDGRWIASTGADKTLRVWDAVSGAQMVVAALDGEGSALAFTADNQQVIVGDQTGAITVWDIQAVKTLLGNVKFPEMIHEVKLAPSGEWIIANTDDFTVWKINAADLLNIKDGTQGTPLFSVTALTYSMEISPDSGWIAVAEPNRSRAILYNIQQNNQAELAHGSYINDVAFTPDSQKVATAGADSRIVLWNVREGKQLLEMKNEATAASIAISPDGKYLVAGLNGDAASTIWDLSTGSKMNASLKTSGKVNQVAFSPDGQWLAVGDALGVCQIWNVKDIANPVLSYTLKQNGKVTGLTFNPDGRWLLTGSSEGFVQLWEMSSGEELARLPHNSAVTGMAIAQGSNWLLSAANKTIQIWNLGSVNLIHSQDLVEAACGRLLSNLSPKEWETVYGKDDSYHVICQNLSEDQ